VKSLERKGAFGVGDIAQLRTGTVLHIVSHLGVHHGTLKLRCPLAVVQEDGTAVAGKVIGGKVGQAVPVQIGYRDGVVVVVADEVGVGLVWNGPSPLPTSKRGPPPNSRVGEIGCRRS
jgi:hypothetical protein